MEVDAFDAEAPGTMLRMPYLGVDTVTCTLYNGDRVYLKAQSARAASARAASALVSSSSATGMLRTPIAQMVAQEHQDRLQREMSRGGEEDAALQGAAGGSLAASSSSSSSSSSGSGSGSEASTNQLWVEKYRPTRFSQLLSDERVNREVLRWIKAWDPICQPQKAAGSAAAVTSAVRNALLSPSTKGAPRAAKQGGDAKSVQLRPNEDEMLLMLSGPPGTGKTTLAHIAARHAGYEPLEINASDDRSVKALRDKIISAMESRAIFGERRPRCIILDEIDGALGGGEVAGISGLLLELCKAPLRRGKGRSARGGVMADKDEDSDGDEDSATAAAGKKKGGKHALVCPIICICNDAYAPALRPLRSVSRAWAFEKCSADRLLMRLKVICRAEKLAMSAVLLKTLVETTEQDVRSCLHSLQFMQGLSGQLTIEMMARMAIGKKDSQRGLFDLWGDVLQAQSSRRARGADKSSFEYFSRTFSESNEHDRAIQGIQANVLSLRYSDPNLSKMNACLDWIGVSDLWQERCYSQQNFAMLNFLPSVAVAVRQMVGERAMGKGRIEYPKQLGALHSETAKAHNILQTFVDGRGLVAGRCARTTVLQVLGPFLQIVSPVQLRDVNPSLLKDEEQKHFDNLVQILFESKLTFKSSHSSFGGRSFHALEP